MMSYTDDQIHEIKILQQFNLDSTQSGIKIHSSATSEVIAAAQRLFDKGLISQADGGYLTDLGHTAAEHAQALYTILISTHE